MITIPGYLFILLAGTAIALLGAVHGAAVKARTARIFGWVATALGVVLVILAALLAVSA